MYPETGYELCNFCENRARDTPLWGVYIPHCDQTSVKNFSFSSPIPLGANHCTGGVKFGTAKGPNFTPIGATCRLCGAKNLKIGL